MRVVKTPGLHARAQTEGPPSHKLTDCSISYICSSCALSDLVLLLLPLLPLPLLLLLLLLQISLALSLALVCAVQFLVVLSYPDLALQRGTCANKAVK